MSGAAMAEGEAAAAATGRRGGRDVGIVRAGPRRRRRVLLQPLVVAVA